MAKFSKKEAIRFGWQTTKQNWKLLACSNLIIFVINIAVPAGFDKFRENTLLFILLNAAITLLNVVMEIGLYRMILNLIDGKPAHLKQLFTSAKLVLGLNYILASLLYGLVIMAGIFLLVIPGIIWSLKYAFTEIAVIDRALRPFQALKKSGQITAGAKWELFKFFILLGLVNILGFLVVGVGLLLTIPTSIVAMVYVYRKLLEPEAQAVVSGHLISIQKSE